MPRTICCSDSGTWLPERTAISEGFAVRSGNQVPESLQQMVRGMVDTAMLRCGASDYVLAVSTGDGERIEIEFAAGAHRDGRLRAELGDPGRYTVKIIVPSAALAKPLADDLKAQGFRKVRIEVDTGDDPAWLKYGGARPDVLDRIDAAVARHYGGVALPREKAWPASDHDIFIRLPASLRVGDIVLEKAPGSQRHPRTPQSSYLTGFCIDQVVAETLHFTVQAVRGRYPAALEGPTAASKTWALIYLAGLLGAGLYRVNLSAQSDVSELVGRFVPDTAGGSMFRFQYGPAPLAMTEGAWLVLDEVNLAPTEVLERS